MSFWVGCVICNTKGFALLWQSVKDVPSPKEVDCLGTKAQKALPRSTQSGERVVCLTTLFLKSVYKHT